MVKAELVVKLPEVFITSIRVIASGDFLHTPIIKIGSNVGVLDSNLVPAVLLIIFFYVVVLA